MDIRFQERDAFWIYGHAVEVAKDSNGDEDWWLWQNFSDEFENNPENDSCFYVVSWTSADDRRWCLMGVDNEQSPDSHMASVEIPAGCFAVAIQPKDLLEPRGWVEFVGIELPELGREVDYERGTFFEFYDGDRNCELWAPVSKLSVLEEADRN